MQSVARFLCGQLRFLFSLSSLHAGDSRVYTASILVVPLLRVAHSDGTLLWRKKRRNGRITAYTSTVLWYHQRLLESRCWPRVAARTST